MSRPKRSIMELFRIAKGETSGCCKEEKTKNVCCDKNEEQNIADQHTCCK